MKSLIKKLVISLVIGSVMLYLAAREISFDGVWEALSEAHWGMLFPYVGCMALQHFFRAWRWRQLLEPIHPVPFSRILPIASVGFFAILALPLRMGEFVRPYLIADPPHIRMSHGLGTMAVERVFDGLILALTAFIAVVVARAQGRTVPGWIFGAGLVALGLFCTALVVLVMTLWQRDRAVAICKRLIGIASERIAERAARIAEGVVDGFKVLPNFRRLALFLGATLVYWAFNAASFWVLSFGFELHIDFAQSVALMSLIGIGIMVPAAPGFIGSFDLFAQGALAMYVSPAVLARSGSAFVLISHAANALWYIATGSVAMFSSHIKFKRVWSAPADSNAVMAQEPQA